MIIASIDLGSNSLSILIAKIDNHRITPIFEKIYLIRLAQGIKENSLLHEDAKKRCLNVFKKIETLITKYNPDHILAVGTAALRNAIDGEIFSKSILKNFNIPIKIISGQNEANLTYLATINEFKKYNKNICMIDIGGASTEIVVGNSNSIFSKISLDIGTVNLTEEFINNDPPTKNELDQMEIKIKKILTKKIHFPFNKENIHLGIGVAGTLTTLKSIDLNIQKYDSKIIHGSKLNIKNLTKIKKKLCKMKIKDRIKLNGIDEKRADIIPTGSIILKLLMKELNLKSIYINDRGLRWGLIYNHIKTIN